jgi:hypothetical protein
MTIVLKLIIGVGVVNAAIIWGLVLDRFITHANENKQWRKHMIELQTVAQKMEKR